MFKDDLKRLAENLDIPLSDILATQAEVPNIWTVILPDRALTVGIENDRYVISKTTMGHELWRHLVP